MPSLPKIFLIITGISGLFAVVLGAFGAHALKAQLDQQALDVWQTAVNYHFFHTLALFGVAVLMQQSAPVASLKVAGWLFTAGLILFSGSLYLLALGGPRLLGPVTPLGGLCFIAAWCSLLVYAVRS